LIHFLTKKYFKKPPLLHFQLYSKNRLMSCFSSIKTCSNKNTCIMRLNWWWQAKYLSILSSFSYSAAWSSLVLPSVAARLLILKMIERHVSLCFILIDWSWNPKMGTAISWRSYHWSLIWVVFWCFGSMPWKELEIRFLP
jgi:hypothetical protein